MFSFEARSNQKMPNGVNLNVVRNGHLSFSYFSTLTPITQNCFFQKQLPIKFKTFNTLGNRNICYQDTYKQQEYNVSRQYLYFWLFNGQKPGEGDDITF